jgi:hypothetical protein
MPRSQEPRLTVPKPTQMTIKTTQQTDEHLEKHKFNLKINLFSIINPEYENTGFYSYT